MRDIRPTPKLKPHPLNVDEILRDTAHEAAARPAVSTNPPKLVGSKVDVSSIEVPNDPRQKLPLPKRSTSSGGNVPGFTKSNIATKPKVGHRERSIIFILLGLVGVIAVLAAVLFLPKADITLVLRTAPLLVDEQITLAMTQAASKSLVPGTAFFREVAVEGTQQVASTKIIGAKASGTVYIINRTVEPQSIKEQSRLETADGTLFYMQKGVTVPAAGGSPAVATVEVVAAEAGDQGNVQKGKLNFPALDGSSQTLVYGEVREPLTGGSGETVPSVSEEDLLAAQQQAGVIARAKVEEDIRGELPSGWVVLEESWTGEMLEFTTPISIDNQEPQIPFQARVNVRVMGYEEEVLEQYLRAALEGKMQEEYMLFPGEISYTKTISSIDWENSTAQVSARVTHTTIPRFSLETLRDKLIGQKEVAARDYLSGLPGVRSVQLELSPFWVNSIPRLNNRIDIELIPERQP